MPATIQVILQHDVEKVGTSGELVKVRPGFARNYLLPRSLAVTATESAINRIAHEKIVAQAKAEKSKAGARAIAAQIDALSIRLERKVGEDDRLFGSVTAKEIESAVKAKGIASFDRKTMHLPEPIKALGSFTIPVKLLTDVTATLKVEVVKK
jgi:large subunit ribosomal protein L9